MRRFIVVIALLLLAAASLAGFEPRPEHFASQADWNLFASWRENGAMHTVSPAAMTSRSIEMQWKSARNDDDTATVTFDMFDGKVTRLREHLPLDRPANDRYESSAALVECVWFALQARRPEAITPLLDTGLHIMWRGLEQQAAIDSLLGYYPTGRLKALRSSGFAAQIFGDELKLDLHITLSGEQDLYMRLPTGQRADDMLLHALPQRVTPPSAAAGRLTVDSTPQPYGSPTIAPPASPIVREPDGPSAPPGPSAPTPHEPFQPIGDVDLIMSRSANLGEFVDATWDKSLSRRLLHNKVSSLDSFLLGEYPRESYSNNQREDLHVIDQGRGPDGLGSRMQVRQQSLPDGVNVVADESYSLERNALILPDGEAIDLSALTEEEAELLAPSFVQLTYLHRSLGTKLLDFLLLPDIVATTMVVKGKERRIYEPRNYFQSLLILSRWWRGRTVYFSIRDVKKVNSHVEFRGYLAAVDETGRADWAEIRFHLNNEYRLDLAMLFLYPDIDLQSIHTTIKE